MHRYKILRPLESGPRIRVYLLADPWQGRVRRVMTLLNGRGKDPRSPEALEAIFSLRRTIDHPRLIRVLDLACRGRRMATVSEFVEDVRPSVPLSGERRLLRSFALELAELVAYLHQKNFFFGQLKPSQFLFDGAGRWTLNLLLPASWLFRHSEEPFSIRYAAPEYVATTEATRQADLYSLGMILYRIFTGQPPYSDRDASSLRSKQQTALPVKPRKINPDVPAEIEELILSLIRRDPERRPSSADEVVAELGGADFPQAANPPRLRSVLVGRQREVRTFRETLGRWLRSRRPFEVLVVSGSGGIGKTRLNQQFEIIAKSLRVPTCSLAHHPGDEPFQVFQTLLGRFTPESQSRGDAFLRPRSFLERLAGHSWSGSRGLLLLIDDLQWMDEGSLEVYRLLAGQARLPWMIVGNSCSDGSVGHWQQLRQELNRLGVLQELRIDPLSDEQILQLTFHLLGEVTSELRAQLLSNCAGKPLYLHEFIRGWKQSGRIVFRGGQWRWHRPSAFKDPLPSTVRFSLKAGLSGLGPNQRAVLEFLALLSRRVSLDLLALLLDTDFDTVLQVCRDLEEKELLEMTGTLARPVVTLQHDSIGRLLRESLNLERRRSIHRTIARVFEGSLSRGGEPFLCEAIVRHCLLCGDRRKVRRYLEPAVRTLEGARLFRKAASLIDEAVRKDGSLLAAWEIVEKTIELHYLSGQLSRCISFASGILRRGHLSPVREAWIHCRTCSIHLLKNANRRALESAQRGLSKLRESDDPELFAQLQGQLLSSLSQVGKKEEARRVAKRVRRLAGRSSNSNDKLFHSLFLFFWMVEGRVEKAVESEIASIRLCAEREDRQLALAGRLTNIASLYLDSGRWEKTRTIQRFCLDLARQMGNVELEAFAQSLRCVADRRRGLHGKAIRRLSDLLALEELDQNRSLKAQLQIEVAKNLNYQLRPDLALAQLAEAERFLGRDSSFLVKVEARLTRAWSWLLLGRPLRALQTAGRFRRGTSKDRGRLRLLRATARLMREDLSEAWTEACEAESSFAECMSYYRVVCTLLKGEILLRGGEPKKAETVLRLGLRTARDKFCPPWLGRAYALLGKCRSDLGDPEGGRIHCGRALQVLRVVERPGLRAEVYSVLGGIEAKLGQRRRARRNYSAALQNLKPPSLRFSVEHRTSFLARFVSPLETERDSLTPPQTGPRFLQETRDFAMSLEEIGSLKSLADQLLGALGRGLPGAAGSFCLRMYRQGPTKVLACRGRFTRSDRSFLEEPIEALPPAGAGLTAVGGEQRFLCLSLELGGGAKARLQVEAPRPMSEVEFDFCCGLLVIAKLVIQRLMPPPQDSDGESFGLKLSENRVLIGAHAKMKRLFEEIRRIAPTEATVLIVGESGTGKELVARALHEGSARSQGRFLAVNCSAFPASLIENELFGHARGSYTGAARDEAGLVEAASGGTLFLDEVSSMPLELQPRLLRVLEEKKIRRIGEVRERRVNVRVVAAANQSLEGLVEQGAFRPDLYHRLNVCRLRIPPLRERSSDITLLARHFLESCNGSGGSPRRIASEALARLSRYDFPGNVRELSNIIQSACHLARGPVISSADIERRLARQTRVGSGHADRVTRLINDLAAGRACFWRDVKQPFLARDLCRSDVREIISGGLAATGGSYRKLVDYFGLPAKDYRRLLAFLAHHDCKIDFRPFRRREN